MLSLKRDRALWIIAGVFLGWTAVLMGLTALEVFLPYTWRLRAASLNFQNTGTFGDSFGVISALMSSVAAYFAYQAWNASQGQLAEARRRAGEPTYLDLLERRFTLMDRIARGRSRGTDAIQSICSDIRGAVGSGGHSAEKMFRDYTRADQVSGLRNLFRYTYHIVRFAEDLFGFDPKAVGAAKRDNGSYPYVRLLRAQLSDEDLLLIALNALYDPDGYAARELLDRYGLLDNMRQSDRTLFEFDKVFMGDEFGLPPR